MDNAVTLTPQNLHHFRLAMQTEHFAQATKLPGFTITGAIDAAAATHGTGGITDEEITELLRGEEPL